MQRTTAELTAALLANGDLPAGITTKASQPYTPSTITGTSPACQDLGNILFAKTTPGAIAVAKTDFTGTSGQAGSEEIDAFGTSAKATALAHQFKEDATSCGYGAVKLTSGSNTTPFQVTVSPGQHGGADDTAFVLEDMLTSDKFFAQVTVLGDVIVVSGIYGKNEANDSITLNRTAVTKAKATLHIN